MFRFIRFARNAFDRCYSNDVLRYVFYGGLTTLVNWATFFFLRRVAGVSFDSANAVSVVVSVVFAWFVNSRFVFRSETTGFFGRTFEFLKFVGGRAFTAIAEVWVGHLLVNVLGANETVSKTIFLSVFTLTLNWIISKFFVFSGNRTKGVANRLSTDEIPRRNVASLDEWKAKPLDDEVA